MKGRYIVFEPVCKAVLNEFEEPDAEWAEFHRTLKVYEGLEWMTEEQLLSTPL